MKKIIYLTLSIALLSACSLFPTKTSTLTPTPTIPVTSGTITNVPTQKITNADHNPIVAIKTKNGQIVLKLYQDKAPNTVKIFLDKAASGFYNNLTFHRVIAGFMAQGGDPTGTGTGGGREKSELNSVPFKRGSIGLARTPDTKEYSNDSQFFICFTTEQCQQLTGDYVNFGEVISGFDVLDAIQQGDKIIEITQNTK